MIQLGSFLFTDLDKLNEALTDSQVRFSFWEGRRFCTHDGLNVRLNDIIEVVNKHIQTLDKPEKATPIIKTIRKMETRGYEINSTFQDEYFEDQNIFTQIFTGIKHWFGEKWRAGALAELDPIPVRLEGESPKGISVQDEELPQKTPTQEEEASKETATQEEEKNPNQ